ncbi:DUF4326 domain-containing protein [Kocuria salina]|uniref:DUF4326 domain-containing protein n=1 Tax=Kocuria salina TaxID=1929416 RepID=UPI0015945675|nr:DUF4326 domain-containing protein [Kocuria salina]NVC23383.1 DUF4326 domain-containing protein [Kocuria salina]
MSAPKRIQRRRTKGWRMPENTVYVGRGSKWGNPHKVVRDGGFMWVEPGGSRVVCSTDREGNLRERRQEAADLYRPIALRADDVQLAELRGKNLACWCPLDQPCHADVLLEIANGGRP